ncbi:glycosyltransferase family 4 protein [Ekhidna sp. MALMAid0563]|uniref:glycosyltransferase family 4 protein n=1 Tax=Ekhidna sp. MALMAid0563 TaxID=3143937 RepID=UPI0032E03ACB
MKALFLVLHRKDRSPGQRYRHEQYLKYLAENGVDYTVSPLLRTEKEDITFYGSQTLPKIWIGIKALVRRFFSVFSAGNYDVVYIYRDAFFFGTFFEKWLTRKNVKIIYDFDDAIWLMDENPNQGIFNKLKNPEKTGKICSIADRVIVGNKYLKGYASQFNDDIQIIPSTIDLEKYQAEKVHSEKVCIGWTGSFSTIKHFETVLPALEKINEVYEQKVYFKVIGDPTYEFQPLGITGIKWNSETEAEDLAELDIGLMPLPDNEWTKGKCAMKGLQYMALEIATIMSPVGVNSDIIQDGENGFLASSTDEWVERLSLLIEDADLRKRIGKAGKKTVEKDFSMEANKDKWLKAFQF